MDNARPLPRDFYHRSTLLVARDLLGARLVRIADDQRVSGIILETEAYVGEDDQASHARAGRTKRTQIMYGPPGFAYVYFTYGKHWLFNCVTEEEGYPAAVLIRAIQPEEGTEFIAQNRAGRPREEWTNGPAKLCQALAIDGSLKGVDLCSPESPLFLEKGETFPPSSVTKSPRVGLNFVPEPWKSKSWRFLVEKL